QNLLVSSAECPTPRPLRQHRGGMRAHGGFAAHVRSCATDIEGAEREALRGATQTLARFFPELMLDSYHRPDDMQVLPPIIRQANPRYAMICGPCEETFTPHVTYYH